MNDGIAQFAERRHGLVCAIRPRWAANWKPDRRAALWIVAEFECSFYAIAMNGVYVEQADGSMLFHPLPAPSDEDIARLARAMKAKWRFKGLCSLRRPKCPCPMKSEVPARATAVNSARASDG